MKNDNDFKAEEIGATLEYMAETKEVAVYDSKVARQQKRNLKTNKHKQEKTTAQQAFEEYKKLKEEHNAKAYANAERNIERNKKVIKTLKIALPCAGAVLIVLAAVLLGVFAKQIEWKSWQWIIGSVGGFFIFFLVSGISAIMAIISYYWNEDYHSLMGYWTVNDTAIEVLSWASGIVIGLIIIANIVCAFLFKELCLVIFYWISAYMILSSVVSAFLNIKQSDEQKASILNFVGIIGAIGGIVAVSILA